MEILTSRNNAKIKLAAALCTSADTRRETGLFLLEGARLCFDAARCGVPIESVFVTRSAFSRFSDMLSEIIPKSGAVYEIDEALQSKISDTKTPQGVFCICKMLDKNADIDTINSNGKYLAFEELANPMNLGAAARTAEALGLSGLIVNGGCDIYNPKAQRAAMGSLLRLPIYETDSLSAFFGMLKERGMTTFAAVLLDDAESLLTTDFSGGVVCAVGNEGSGLKPQTIDAAIKKIRIPMKGTTESLNAAAAAAVIMWEMMK